MAGVKVDADLRANGFPQTLESVHIIYAEAGVQLKGDLGHAIIPGDLYEILPVGDQYLVPLVF